MEDKCNSLKRLCFVLIACRKKRRGEIGLGCVMRAQFVRRRAAVNLQNRSVVCTVMVAVIVPLYSTNKQEVSGESVATWSSLIFTNTVHVVPALYLCQIVPTNTLLFILVTIFKHVLHFMLFQFTKHVLALVSITIETEKKSCYHVRAFRPTNCKRNY